MTWDNVGLKKIMFFTLFAFLVDVTSVFQPVLFPNPISEK